MTDTPHIGIIGLGRMGTAMAARFAETGAKLIGWNRTPRVIEDLAIAETVSAAVLDSDVIILSLFDGDAVRKVIGEIDASLLKGKLVIDTSTVAPQVSREVDRLIRAIGGRYVDAPVLGTIGPCLRGELVAMIGGTIGDAHEAANVLAPLTRVTHHMGKIGSGAATKLSINLVMGAYWATLGDALALARYNEVDEQRLVEIIRTGPAALASMGAKLPVLEGKSLPVEFDVAGYTKDLRTMLEAADGQLALPTVDAALKCYLETVAVGGGSRDVVTVALRGRERLGAEPRVPIKETT